MYIIYKLVPIERCPNHSDWSYINGQMYAKFIVFTTDDERQVTINLERFEANKYDKDIQYYYTKE